MKSLALVLGVAALLTTTLAFAAADGTLQYPPTHRDKIVDNYFGTRVAAPYQWMKNLDSPALKKWVTAENKLTITYLNKIPIRGWIEQRLTQLWNYAKESTPFQTTSGKLFFSRNSGLQNQSVVYVQDSASAKPRVLLNPNTLSANGAIALAGYQPAPDGKYLSYELSQGGSDWETIHVLDVATGKKLPDAVHWVKFSGVSWTHDDKGFYYSRYPTPPRGKAISQQVVNQKLYYHRLGTPQSADQLIYARPDHPEWIVSGNVSEDGHYLFVYLVNGTSPDNELYYADLGNPKKPHIGAKLKPLFTGNDAQYTIIGHDGDTLFIQTTRDAPRGRIVAAKLGNPAPRYWHIIVPEARGVLGSAAMADGRILANYRIVAKSRLELFATDGKHLDTFALPTLGTVSGISTRNDSRTVYYAFTSFLYPTTLYRHNIANGKTDAYFKPDVNFNAAPYETKQVFYPSKDGTLIPMFIVAKKGVKLNGRNPTILYGYGGFDITITPRFNPMLPVWLEMGEVYAVANLRGGGTYGGKWHQAGMLGHKQNVFDDFAWAAKYLVRKGYTATSHLGIQGYSNGGLLTGASITQRPKLFGAAYIGHGVLDMLRYQKFSGGALWAPEYGTSNNKQAFKWLYAYSPLDNIKQGTCYPPTLITTSWDDDRVVPSHEFKFTAKIQRAQGCANPILLHVTGDTSHVYMPTDKQIAQTVDVWTFEAWNLGIKQAPTMHGKPRD